MAYIFDTDSFIAEVQCRPVLWDTKCHEYSNRHLKMKTWEEVAEVLFENYEHKEPSEKSQIYLTLLRKWKSLRDCYLREFNIRKKAKTGEYSKKPYVYFDQLSFLCPVGGIPVRRKRKIKTSVDDAKTEHDGATNEYKSPAIEKEDDSNDVPRIEIGHEGTPTVQVDVRRSAITTRKRSRDALMITDIKSLQDNKAEKMPQEYLLKKNSLEQCKNQIDEQDPDKLFLLSLLPDIKKVHEDDRLEMKCEIMSVIGKWKRQQKV